MLLPFEGMGVDAFVGVQMPKASNPFDYSHHRRRAGHPRVHGAATASTTVSRSSAELDRTVEAIVRTASVEQFPDPWYDLNNPEQTATPMTVSFDTTHEDFPPNIEELMINHIVSHLVRPDREPFSQSLLTTNLYFTPQGGTENGGGASSTDGGFQHTKGQRQRVVERDVQQSSGRNVEAGAAEHAGCEGPLQERRRSRTSCSSSRTQGTAPGMANLR